MDGASRDANANEEASQSNDNREILAAINSLKAEFTTRHDEVLTAIHEIKKDLSSFAGRLDTAENRIGKTEDIVAVMEDRLGKMQKVVTTLTDKCDDLENRSRRSNLRVVGLPEQAEGKDAESFLEKWIPEVLGLEHFSTPLIIGELTELVSPGLTSRQLLDLDH
ncbi:hypothetical protein AAFF_G00043480 [Aldrovandia affinis]|uniref:Uncharacterized protein n=1 Tax=Aldrovandia affinis TaxID=143900 RepID=A0AAD7R1Y9_9TELE|nr:hypothetical protein AAFF_G00043480 [Aldrovandia affinis]